MSGALTMLMASGGQMGVVSLPASIVSTLNESGGAGVTLANDGTWTAIGDGGNWVATWDGNPLGGGIAASYQARASSLAGDTGDATGTFDTWLDLSTTRAWGVSGTNKLVTFTIEIRGKNHVIVFASSSVTCSTAA